MSQWASLGGFGNVDMRGSLPFGNTDNTGALGMIAQMLMRQGSQSGGAQGEYDPEAEEEMARLLGLMPQQQGPSYASLGMRGY
jgi:hypothetical protein